MTENLRKTLAELSSAHKNSEKFFAQWHVPGEQIIVHDFFEMAQAFEAENIAHLKYEIALAEAYPEQFPPEAISYFTDKLQNHEKLLACWKNRKLPAKE